MNEIERKLDAVFFRTDTGSEPVREWLLSLAKGERKIIGGDVLKVQYCWPVGKPLVGNLRGSGGKIKGSGVFVLPHASSRGDFQGRPRARNVDCSPSRFAVRCCHDASPNGAPRTTERRNASNSASVCGACTCCANFSASLPDPRRAVRTGPRGGDAKDLTTARRRPVRPNWPGRAFRSTYRSTLKR